MTSNVTLTLEIEDGSRYGLTTNINRYLSQDAPTKRDIEMYAVDAREMIEATLLNHFQVGVLEKVEEAVEPDMVETTKLTDKKRTFVPAQTIHKYSDGQCFVDDKPITSLNYEAMTMLGAHIQNHAHRYGDTCPDGTFNLDTPATYGETK